MTTQTSPGVLKETTLPVYFTNDIKLTAALITAGVTLVEAKSRTNPKNSKKEILFGFEQTDKQQRIAMQFLSGKLSVDAKTLMDNRDSLLSYVTNGSREILEKLSSRG